MAKATSTGTDEPGRVRGEQVASYFPVLGIRAAVGGTFLPEEDSVPEGDMVAAPDKPVCADYGNRTLLAVAEATPMRLNFRFARNPGVILMRRV